MPLYEYYCEHCNGVFELIRPVRQAAQPQPCPECDDDAKRILRAFAFRASRGMLPNRLPEAGEEPAYDTADATMWLFVAVRDYLLATGDDAFVVDEILPVLRDIVAWHDRGTRFGIGVDADGLLRAGEAGVALTWMDAKVDGRAVTPRVGKAVEINALWYNALLETWLNEFGKRDVLNKVYILAGVTPIKSLKMAQKLAEVPGVYLPKHILQRMEVGDKAGNAQEEGIQIALEIIGKIKAYEKQGISGIHLMPVGWDEIIPRIVTEAGIASKQLLFDKTS